MPDLLLMAMGLALGAILAGGVLFVIVRPGSSSVSWRLAAGWAGGLGVGIYASCYLLGEWPRWPPTEDRHRFLVILLPLALAVEAAAMLLPARRWPVWFLRISLAAATPPVLLYNTSYLADLDGPDLPGIPIWNRAEAVLILGLSAMMLTGLHSLLVRLRARTSDRALALILTLVILGSGVTVMLCGYYRGGLLALPMAGAITGVTLASCAILQQPVENASLGVGILGIFTLCFIGRFFGSLPTGLALGLPLVPLLAWTAELPRIRKLPPAARAAIRMAAVLAALVAIVTWAQIRFNASSGL